jgi:hypothetical protein
MKKYLPVVLSALAVFLFFFLLFSSVENSKAATATHVVISEIKTQGVNASDEFIELYNPTPEDIDLTEWKVTRRSQGEAASEVNIIASMSGEIKSHGYFLLANDSSTSSPAADMLYAAPIGNNTTITLYSSTNSQVDRVGTGTNVLSETQPIQLHLASGSIERKANSFSTSESMSVGIDANAGNGEDTDNNLQDFILREVSNPQNSQSNLEPVQIPPSPTTEPTPTVTVEPSPTLTQEPSPTGTEMPTPTDIPTPTVTKPPTPTVTTTPLIQIPNLQISCTQKVWSFNIFGSITNFILPTCRVARVN